LADIDQHRPDRPLADEMDYFQTDANSQRIRYAKLCPMHGPVDSATIVKGYEYGPQQVVPVEPEELDRLRPAQDRALRLERFLSPAEMDPLLFSGRSLALAPDGSAARLGYVVLCQALTQRQRWAVGRMVLGGHRSLVLVRPAGAQLVAHLLYPPERIQSRVMPTIATGQDVNEELRLAEQLIDAASGRIDWGAFRDDSAAELRALIEVKLQGLPVAAGPGPVVLPLRQALQQSVAEAPERERPPISGKRSTAPTSSGRPKTRRA
jgi:DNA end-binding protein Ku